MPYIKKSERARLEPLVSELAEALKETEELNLVAGNLNYVLTRLLRLTYGESPRYVHHNEAIGVLECVKQEWYRRATAPYEERKKIENGDVY